MAFAGLASLEDEDEKELWMPQSRVHMLLHHFVDARGEWIERRQRFSVRLERNEGRVRMVEEGGLEPVRCGYLVKIQPRVQKKRDKTEVGGLFFVA